MGDRVLMQCFSSKNNSFGPVMYCHNGGYEAPAVVRSLSERMEDRQGDLEYSSARLVQCAIGNDDYNTGFGMWNAQALLDKDDTHGDAGVILIDVDNGHKCQCMGGYLKVGDDGFPMHPED